MISNKKNYLEGKIIEKKYDSERQLELEGIYLNEQLVKGKEYKDSEKIFEREYISLNKFEEIKKENNKSRMSYQQEQYRELLKEKEGIRWKGKG